MRESLLSFDEVNCARSLSDFLTSNFNEKKSISLFSQLDKQAGKYTLSQWFCLDLSCVYS